MSLGYIGSKKSLIDFITQSLSKHVDLNKHHSFADLFAGTGFVGNYFNKEFKFDITANDMEYYSFILNSANLNSAYSDKLQTIIDKINIRGYDIECDNLIKRTYTPFESCERMFFTVENGDFIDYCMNVFIHLEKTKEIDEDELIFLKASLMVNLDKVANTTSVYGAYLKKYKKSALKTLELKPVHMNKTKGTNTIHHSDILKLKMDVDICYLDPPYNNRQYSNNYSQLNYILKYDEDIEIKGKTGLIKNWNRSNFCYKKTILQSLEDTVENINAKYK